MLAVKQMGSLLLLSGLLGLGFVVFARVGRDYQARGKLSPVVAFMQTGYFLLYALASYACLDSRLSHIGISAWLLGVAILMMLAGCLLVMFSMPFLGKQSFGHEVTRLRRDGIYRYSRNPQLVGGFLLVVGYASLWPSWQGALWAALWIAISHLMIRGEERHLQDVFGDEYRSYCAQTPRFVGWPRR